MNMSLANLTHRSCVLNGFRFKWRTPIMINRFWARSTFWTWCMDKRFCCSKLLHGIWIETWYGTWNGWMAPRDEPFLQILWIFGFVGLRKKICKRIHSSVINTKLENIWHYKQTFRHSINFFKHELHEFSEWMWAAGVFGMNMSYRNFRNERELQEFSL